MDVHSQRAVPVTMVIGLVVVAVMVAALDLNGRWPGGLVTEPSAGPTRAPAALDPRPADAGPVLDVPRVAAPPALPVGDLLRLLDSGPLGPAPGALVLDVASGQTLVARESALGRTPASVLKLVTGAAALTTLDPTARLRTRVVTSAAPGELVLVGAGDTTLTVRPRRGTHPARAGLADLADATAAALRDGGTSTVTVRVDDSLFSGPARSPDWRRGYVDFGVVSPVSALSLDAGRVSPTSDVREADPAVAAGRRFAGLLERRGVTVSGEAARAKAPEGARELAGVDSPTVGELVELMVSSSDNDLAESLLRLVAVESGRPGTFADGTTAVAAALTELGLPTDGLVILDGSGLARGSRISPDTVAALLVAATERPALGPVVAGLPVAGFSGTLSMRYGAGRAGAAAGLVRAKTGTLTGVSTLAGLASVDDHALVFVVMADRVPADTLAAQATLDRFAARLVR